MLIDAIQYDNQYMKINMDKHYTFSKNGRNNQIIKSCIDYIWITENIINNIINIITHKLDDIVTDHRMISIKFWNLNIIRNYVHSIDQYKKLRNQNLKINYLYNSILEESLTNLHRE